MPKRYPRARRRTKPKTPKPPPTPTYIVVGPARFPSRRSVVEYLRLLAIQYSGSEVPLEHAKLVIAVLRDLHPCGPVLCENVVTVAGDGWGQLSLICADGRSREFNRRRLQEGIRARFANACRAAVQDQVLEFKSRLVGTVVCPITNLECPAAMVEADHMAPKFSVIVDEFVTMIQQSAAEHPDNLSHQTPAPEDIYTRVSYELHPMYDTSVFSDPELRRVFSDLHRARARLQPTSALANRLAEWKTDND